MTFLAAAVSPVFPVVSIEAWIVFGALIGQHAWLPFIAAAAGGQILCFCSLYLAGGRWVRGLPWVRRKLEKFDPQKYRRSSRVFYATASVFGIPPLNFMSIAGPTLNIPFPLFALFASAGRFFRLGMTYYFAQALQDYLPVEKIPEWIRALA